VASERPVCVTVIGWGTMAVALLMAFSGMMAALGSLAMPDLDPERTRQIPMHFVFAHFALFATAQVGVAALLLFAGRALLQGRRWAARVVEVAAWLGLAYLVLGMAWFAWELRAGLSEAPRLPDAPFVAMVVLVGVFTVFFWGTPLVLTIRSLRSDRVREALS